MAERLMGVGLRVPMAYLLMLSMVISLMDAS